MPPSRHFLNKEHMVMTVDLINEVPVQRARKFSAVFGTTSASNSMTILPAGCPPMEMSKKTCGLPIFLRRITLQLPRAKRKRFGKSTGLMTCLILPQRIVGNLLGFRLDPPSMRKQSESRGVENRLSENIGI